jgi:4'-phosphopantetheinyl transferase
MLDVWCSLQPMAMPPCLDADELRRRDRFLCDAARETFAQAHALKRQVLSRYEPARTPQSWAFVHGEAGKPSVREGFRHHFNLSHSGPCVAVAVADGEVGVDIERHRVVPAAASLVERVFHRNEQQWLARQPDAVAAFFRLWTLKEALLKAAGTGFSHPPEQLCWDGLDDDRASASFAGRRWTGLSRRLAEASIAVAVPDDCAIGIARLLQPADEGWRDMPLLAEQRVPAQRD